MDLNEEIEKRTGANKKAPTPTEYVEIEKPQEIKNLETIIDESIKEVKAMEEEIKELTDEPIEYQKLLTCEDYKENIQELKKDDNDCEFIELLKEKHIESLDGINKVLLTSNSLIKEKANLSRNVLSLTKDLIGVMEKNHKLESIQNFQSIKFLGLGIIVGGILVYMFPEYLPYIKNAANYLNKG